MKNRKLLAVILAVVLTVALAVTAYASFPDVKPGDDYSSAITLLQNLDVVEGDDNGKFNPTSDITRGEFVKMLYVTLNGTDECVKYTGESIYADVLESDWYTPYINWATAYGFVEGYGDGYFGPNDPVTIAQIVKVTSIAQSGKKNLSYPYGYLLEAQANGLLNGVLENIDNVTGKAKRNESCQLMVNLLVKDCAFLGNAKPASLFSVGSTIIDGDQVILIGDASDTNNGKGLTGVDKENEYAVATLKQDLTGATDAAAGFDVIKTFELPEGTNAKVGQPVILFYEKGTDAQGNYVDGFENAKKIISMERGYATVKTLTFNSITQTTGTDRNGASNKVLGYKINGENYTPEAGWLLQEHLIVKTADGSLRAGHVDAYYLTGNGLYSGFDWQSNYRNQTESNGLASGLNEIACIGTNDEIKAYDCDGNGTWDFFWVNPWWELMRVEKIVESAFGDRVILGDVAGSAVYCSGLNVKLDQFTNNPTLAEGDYINITSVKTGLDGVVKYTGGRNSNIKQGKLTQINLKANGQVNNVIVGGTTLSLEYVNIEHGQPSYNYLYSRNAVGNQTENIGKEFKVWLTRNGRIGRVELVGAPVEAGKVYGDLNIAKVVSFMPETIKGEWADTLVYNVVLETLDGTQTTYRAAADLKTVVNATYETLNAVTAYGNAWLKQNSTYNIVLDSEGKNPAINGTYVHYELDAKGEKVTLLMNLDDVLKGYDLPTDALANGYAYELKADTVKWVAEYTAFYSDNLGWIFADDEMLVLTRDNKGKMSFTKGADLASFETKNAKFLVLNGKVLVAELGASIVDGGTAASDLIANILALESYYVETLDGITGKVFIRAKDITGASKTLEVKARATYLENETVAQQMVATFGGNFARVFTDASGAIKNATNLAASPVLGTSTYTPGVLTGMLADYYVFGNIETMDATSATYAGVTLATIAPNVTVYKFKNYTPSIVNGDTILAFKGANLTAGSLSDLVATVGNVGVPVLYHATVDANGFALIDTIFVVEGTRTVAEGVATPDAIMQANNVEFAYGEDFMLSKFYVAVGGTLLFGSELTLEEAPDMSVGAHTVKVSAYVSGVKQVAELYYTVAAGAGSGSGTVTQGTVVVDATNVKTEYNYISAEGKFEAVDITGLVLTVDGEQLLPNQYSVLTQEITKDTTKVEIRAFGQTVSYPITLKTYTKTLFLYATANNNARLSGNAGNTNVKTADGKVNKTYNANQALITPNNVGNYNINNVIGLTEIPTTTTPVKTVILHEVDNAQALEPYVGATVECTFFDEACTVIASAEYKGDMKIVSYADARVEGDKYYFGADEVVFDAKIGTQSWYKNTGGIFTYTDIKANMAKVGTVATFEECGNVYLFDTDKDGDIDWAYNRAITKIVAGIKTATNSAVYFNGKGTGQTFDGGTRDTGWYDGGSYPYGIYGGIQGGLTATTAPHPAYYVNIRLGNLGAESASGNASYIMYTEEGRWAVVNHGVAPTTATVSGTYVEGQSITSAAGLPSVYIERADGSTVNYIIKDADITSAPLALGQTEAVVTVTIGGWSFDVTVTGFTVVEKPSAVTVTYNVTEEVYDGQAVDKADLTVKATYAAGEVEVAAADYELLTTNLNSEDPYIYVKVRGVEAKVAVTVTAVAGTLEIATPATKTTYYWNGDVNTKAWEAVNTDGLTLQLNDGTNVTPVEAGRVTVVTTAITANTAKIEVKAYGQTVSYPITLKVKNVWMVETPEYGSRINNTGNYTIWPSTTFKAINSNNHTLINRLRGDVPIAEAFATWCIGAANFESNNSGAAHAPANMFAIIWRFDTTKVTGAQLDALWGAPVILTLDPATNKVVGVEAEGTIKKITSDRFEYTNNATQSKAFIDGVNVAASMNYPGKRWSIAHANAGYIATSVTTTSGFYLQNICNSGKNVGLAAGDEGWNATYGINNGPKNPNWDKNLQAPDIILLADRNNDGNYDWTFIIPTTRVVSKSVSSKNAVAYTDASAAASDSYTLTGRGGNVNWLKAETCTYRLNGVVNQGIEIGKEYYIQLRYTASGIKTDNYEVGNAVSDLRVTLKEGIDLDNLTTADVATAYVTFFGAEAVPVVTDVEKVDGGVKVTATYLGETETVIVPVQ